MLTTLKIASGLSVLTLVSVHFLLTKLLQIDDFSKEESLEKKENKETKGKDQNKEKNKS